MGSSISKKRYIRIPAKEIRDIAQKRPMTHEIGGLMFFDSNGTYRSTQLVGGGKCRGKDGAHIVQCSVQIPEGQVHWQTHPKGNRPSSTDLRNALVFDARSGGVRKTNLMFSPHGVWVFRPAQRLVEEFKQLSPAQCLRRVKVWKFLGHYFQPDLQKMQVEEFQQRLRDHGFENRFYPYASFSTDNFQLAIEL